VKHNKTQKERKMKLTTIFIGGLVCLSCVSINCIATTYYVNPGESIQAAIESAADGDTVVVLPGVYAENLNLRGKAITLISEAGADSTIIDGWGLTVVTMNSGEDSRTIIDGFTLQYGYEGVYCGNGVSPEVRNCVIEWNDYGFYCEAANPRFLNCEISDNWEYSGYGLNCNEEIKLEGCTVSIGLVSTQVRHGFYFNNSKALFTGCEISSVSGRCIFIQNGSQVRTYETDIWVLSNSPAIEADSSSAELFNTRIFGGSHGAYMKGSDLKLRGCFITEVIRCDNSNATIEQSSMTSEISISGATSIANISQSMIYGRKGRAIDGGGGVQISLVNSIIYNSESGCEITGSSSINIVNSTITGCEGTAGLWLKDSASAVVKNSIIWNEETSSIVTEVGSSAQVDHCIIKGGWSGDNIDQNPLLDYDYAPLPGSPCIDAGDPTVNVGMYDVDGDFRYVNSTSNPSDLWDGSILYRFMNEDDQYTMMWKGIIDIGAKEHQIFQPTYETFHVMKSTDMQDWQEVFVGNTAVWSDTESSSADRGFYQIWAE
jgi:Right handed beta helix region